MSLVSMKLLRSKYSVLIFALVLGAVAHLSIQETRAEGAKAGAPPQREKGLRGLFDDLMGASPETSSTEGETEAESDDDGLPVLMQSGLQGGASTFLTPVDVLSEKEIARAVPWRAPDYQGQTSALGWSPNVFDVPDGLKSRVAFWREIYSRYTTDQGLLHDTSHVDIIYEPVDFTPIMRDPTRNAVQKARAREQLVNARKKAIVERLNRLQARLKAGQSAAGLVGEDLRVWRMFEKIDGKNKFKDAATKKRLRFQLGQKDRFILGIFYSGRYLPAMEEIFRSEGLPVELTRLPFVESSFNIHARSKVGASGIWQFMPRTGKAYLTVSKAIDERNDPLRATLASARLLKQNYLMLESWPLALTGYNHGAYGVKSIVNKLGTRDISQIVARYTSKSFGFASENFYACFLAALIVEKNARTYFGDVKWSGGIPTQEFKVTQPTSFATLLKFFDEDRDTASLLNPHIQPRVREGKDIVPRGAFVRVPSERAQLAADFFSGKLSYAELGPALKKAQSTGAAGESTAALVPQSLPQTESPIRKRLGKLSSVAAAIFPSLTGHAAATPSPELEPTSSDAPPEAVTAGADQPEAQPKEPSQSEPAVTVLEPIKEASATLQPESAAEPAVMKTHRVRPGESLLKIAKKYGVNLAQLKEVNGMGKKGSAGNKIRAGQTLVVPEAKSASGLGSGENE